MAAMGLMFHVDESIDRYHHFHGGVLLDARDAAGATDALDTLVKHARDEHLCDWNAELHSTDLIGGRNGWRGTRDERFGVFRDALAVLAAHNIEVIAHGAYLPSMRKKYGRRFDPYRWEFTNLLERLNERLVARDEYAVVIADDHAQHRDRLQREVIEARTIPTSGYRSQCLKHIVDTAHFVDSKLSRMTQLADLVVSVLRRRASNRPEADNRAEAVSTEFFGLVWDAIPDPKGKYHHVRM